jgi:hypothetical protein
VSLTKTVVQTHVALLPTAQYGRTLFIVGLMERAAPKVQIVLSSITAQAIDIWFRQVVCSAQMAAVRTLANKPFVLEHSMIVVNLQLLQEKAVISRWDLMIRGGVSTHALVVPTK